MSATTTAAPALARVLQNSVPSRPAPPVTMATRLLSSNSCDNPLFNKWDIVYLPVQLDGLLTAESSFGVKATAIKAGITNKSS